MTANRNQLKTSCHKRQQGYETRQRAKDEAYEEAYKKHVASLSPLDRQKLREKGLDKPDTDYATYSPDTSGLMESIPATSTSSEESPAEKTEGDAVVMEALRLLRMALSNVFYPGPGRSREYELDVLGVSIGILGLHSITAVANRHGVGRAAISKAARNFCNEAGLPPSIYMKSEANREKHRQTNKRGRKRA